MPDLFASCATTVKTELHYTPVEFRTCPPIMPDGAGLAAELATGEAAPRVYAVEPTGAFEDDPNVTDKKFPGNPTLSYRSRDPH